MAKNIHKENTKKLDKTSGKSLTKWIKCDSIMYILCKRQPNHNKSK
jgi:hypothetical protein